MTVKVKIAVGITDILMGIHIGRIHFQFLIKRTWCEAHVLKQCVNQNRILGFARYLEFCSYFLKLGQFHKINPAIFGFCVDNIP